MSTCWHSTPLRSSASHLPTAEEERGFCTAHPLSPLPGARPGTSDTGWSTLDKAETCTLSRGTTTDAATSTEETVAGDSLERVSLEVETGPGGSAKDRLETLALSFEKSKRHYRRRLAARLACAFCVLMFVAIAICLACVAMLLHIEPPRGVLVAMEGTFEMIPSNSSHCVVGKPEVISAYKSGTINDVENRLDSVSGSMSAASRYVGALVEDFRCLLRPDHPGVRVELDFTLFWRRRRNRYGILSASPSQRVVADALHRELSHRPITGFSIDLDSITLADSRVIA